MAIDYFLKLDGVEGESADRQHKGWIEIESFQWGCSHPSPPGTSQPTVQDFHFATSFSKASPKLAEMCTSSGHITFGDLVGRKAGGAQEEFYKVHFADLLVSSYQSGGSGGDRPMESLSLNFIKFEIRESPTR